MPTRLSVVGSERYALLETPGYSVGPWLQKAPPRPRVFANVRSRSANLVLVCSRHHTLIHSQEFRLVLHPDRRLDLTTAEGVPLLHHPAQPWGDPTELATACGQMVSAETLQPDHCEGRMDLGYVVSVLMAQAS